MLVLLRLYLHMPALSMSLSSGVWVTAVFVPRQTLGKHCLLLDEAVDAVIKDKINRGRDVTFFGCGFCSDESPPAGSRFSGFRFQLSILYVPFFEDPQDWDEADQAPVHVQKVLCDMTHCPGKDGAAVLHVLDKQISRFGLSRADLCSGTGDGGGENEGLAGVHSSLERDNTSYVRHRCLGHLSWRTADSILDNIGDEYKDIQFLCTYFHEGATWKRLQSI
jgi:hypothetical protein